jgi:hypothetical protein
LIILAIDWALIWIGFLLLHLALRALILCAKLRIVEEPPIRSIDVLVSVYHPDLLSKAGRRGDQKSRNENWFRH